MAQPRATPSRLTPEAYLASEQGSTIRHEFVDGQVFAMAGASERHSIVKLNFIAALLGAKPSGCRIFDGDMKLRVESGNESRFYYPDIFVACQTGEQDQHVRRDAVLVIEVLSPSTERVDRFEKFVAYTTLPTLMEYVLVAQDSPHVEIRRRRTDWSVESYVLESSFRLESVGLTLDVAAAYADIDFLKALAKSSSPQA